MQPAGTFLGWKLAADRSDLSQHITFTDIEKQENQNFQKPVRTPWAECNCTQLAIMKQTLNGEQKYESLLREHINLLNTLTYSAAPSCSMAGRSSWQLWTQHPGVSPYIPARRAAQCSRSTSRCGSARCQGRRCRAVRPLSTTEVSLIRPPDTSHWNSYATPRLLQRNTRRTSCISAQSTSVGAQCRCQTDTSIFSVWAHHTNAARPTLAAVSVTHQFQVNCAHLQIPARCGATVSFRLHPERRRFQPQPSPVVVIIAASEPTYTAVHCW